MRRGEPSFGIWLADGPTCARIEFYGHLGYEFVIVDAEHLAIDVETIQNLVRACDVVGLVPIVRPPNHDASTILTLLEMGVMGLYVPHVRSANDARTIIDRVKYAPMGSRSAGLQRTAKYGLTQSAPEYYRQANIETMVALLVEDIEGLSNLAEILEVEGVDVVCIGAGDLSHSMGYVGESSHPEVLKAVRAAEAQIAAAGMPFDCEAQTADDAREAISRGARLIPFFERVMLKTLFTGILRDLITIQRRPVTARE